jgi:hypothetical protein
VEDIFAHLSESFFGHREQERSIWESGTWVPAIESHVDKGNLMVKEEKDYFYREVEYGTLSRSITLPEGVEADTINTTYKNGVLEITMRPLSNSRARKYRSKCKNRRRRAAEMLARGETPEFLLSLGRYIRPISITDR